MKRIRRHLSYANVAASLALVFAMSGGALAATGGFVGSDGKLQACVSETGGLVLLKTGKHCKKGQKAVAWNQAGVPGPKGATGTTGAAGAAGASGSNGANGTTGFTSTLPSGKTEVGTWAANVLAAASPYYIPISFNIPLLERPRVRIIGKEAASTAECPGTVANPQAASGNLCVYVGELFSGGTLFSFAPDQSGFGAKSYGTILGMKSEGGVVFGYGTWAVTG